MKRMQTFKKSIIVVTVLLCLPLKTEGFIAYAPTAGIVSAQVPVTVQS